VGRRRWTPAAAGLFVLALACEMLLTRGFLQAAAADSAAFNGSQRADAFPAVSYSVLQMTTAWARGAFRPAHLESWERSSFPVSALAVTAFALSVRLRRPRR
jgi:hypothetical protein